MKKLVLFVLIFFVLSSPQLAKADPFVCFNGVTSGGRISMLDASPADLEIQALFAPSTIRCETAARLQTGLTAVSLAFSVTGFALACTGIGATATVALEGSALGLEMLSLTVGLLPCDDSTNEAKVKKLAADLICAQLEAQGTACRIQLP